MEKDLGSGMIRGIEPVYATRMVRRFGKDVFDVIEASPKRLREGEGIGPMRGQDHLRPGGPEGRRRDHGLPA
jgi:exodeoxyribonuclease V alpha subunit